MELIDELTGTTYVQTASHTVFDGTSLILQGLAPATVFLTAVPGSSVGYLTTGMFLDHWYAEASGAGTRAVQAVLSFLLPDQTQAPVARVTLSLPRIRGTGVEYHVGAVTGDIPEVGGAAVLFISPMAEPVTPR